ncbi:hypothetical protein BDZ45DRAFT_671533 [Acephala macrosclerotiorum]|nr:hypothetical protein BDZ45DRAFT_671533 [Acephala macrosclerotiorum]
MASPTILTEIELGFLTDRAYADIEYGYGPKMIQAESIQRCCPLDNGRLEPRDAKSSAPISDFGNLECFPLEIIDSILRMFDLQSLTNFRAVNWHARTLVDNITPYKAIIQHAPDVLRGLLSTQMAVHFTTEDIFEALCTQACFGCGQYGGFLDMFTAHRYCIICIADSEDLQCITAFSARQKFGLDTEAMRTLPTLLSVPGRFSYHRKYHRNRISLVRTSSAVAAKMAQTKCANASSHASSLAPAPVRRSKRATARIPLPQTLQQLDKREEVPFRYMAMVRIPFLDRESGRLDWGVRCRACLSGYRHHDETRGLLNWQTAFSAKGYLDHFQKCQLSQVARRAIPDCLVPDEENRWSTPISRLSIYLRDYQF